MQNKPLASANRNWGHAQILNSDGNPYRPNVPPQPPSNTGGGGGASGGDPMIDIAGLKKNVGFLNWVAGIATVAIVALYFILTAQIDNRFDKVDDPLDQIGRDVAAQTATLSEIDRRLGRLEDRNESKPQGSNREE